MGCVRHHVNANFILSVFPSFLFAINLGRYLGKQATEREDLHRTIAGFGMSCCFTWRDYILELTIGFTITQNTIGSLQVASRTRTLSLMF